MTILLIDDEKVEYYLFGLALKRLKIQADIFSVAGCEDALNEMLGKLSSLPDFVVVDLDMPMNDGYACFKMLQSDARLTNIPLVIYCSDRPKTVKNLLRSGACCYLNKSKSFLRFCENLKTILQAKWQFESPVTLLT